MHHTFYKHTRTFNVKHCLSSKKKKTFIRDYSTSHSLSFRLTLNERGILSMKFNTIGNDAKSFDEKLKVFKIITFIGKLN